MKRAIIFSAIAFVATAIGTAHAGKTAKTPPPAVADGKPKSCIPLSTIRETKVHGDSTIDFHVSKNKIYRNQLPNPCSGLGFEERFSYRTSLNQLCSTDIITVLRLSPGGNGPSCGLGQFQPMTLAETKPR